MFSLEAFVYAGKCSSCMLAANIRPGSIILSFDTHKCISNQDNSQKSSNLYHDSTCKYHHLLANKKTPFLWRARWGCGNCLSCKESSFSIDLARSIQTSSWKESNRDCERNWSSFRVCVSQRFVVYHGGSFVSVVDWSEARQIIEWYTLSTSWLLVVVWGSERL